MAKKTTQESDQKALYVNVVTTDKAGKMVGERIVDLYHFGTRNWLHNHTWWAMHNGHSVEQNIASSGQVDRYMADMKVKLVEKFNGGEDTPHERAA